jgi:hypothetical protein
MGAKLVAGFSFIILVGTVDENPASVLGPTGPVDETADLVVFTLPKSPNVAVVPIFSPQHRIDVSLGIEGCNEIISMARRAVGKLPGAGEIQQDAMEVGQFS